MNAKEILDDRMSKGIRQMLAEAEAKKQTARIKRLRALLAEVEASR